MITPVFKDIWTDKQYCNEDFKRDGYVKVPVHGGNRHCHRGLHQIMEDVVRIICDHLDLSEPKDYEDFLSNIHTEVSVDQLNPLRMLVYNKMNELLWLRTSTRSRALSSLRWQAATRSQKRAWSCPRRGTASGQWWSTDLASFGLPLSSAW